VIQSKIDSIYIPYRSRPRHNYTEVKPVASTGLVGAECMNQPFLPLVRILKYLVSKCCWVCGYGQKQCTLPSTCRRRLQESGAGRLKTLGDVPDGRDNHFNLIRLLAAAAVLISHSFPLSLGKGSAEPLDELTGYSLGALAVYVFFGISGYMITRSFERRRDLCSFIAARITRIFPGLLVALALTFALVGPLVTSLGLARYLSDLAVWTYIPRNLSLAFLQYELPGVFGSNPYPGAINGSLWTLFWEVACYGMVVVLGLFGALSRRWFGLFLLLFFAVAGFSVLQAPPDVWLQLSTPFVTGMAIYVFRPAIPMGWGPLAVVIIGAALLRDTAVWPIVYGAALAYAALWFGYAPAPALLGFNRYGDYSYGTYIYAFPVQQLVAWKFDEITPVAMIALSMPTTLLLACLSWHLIEAPALARREALAGLLRRVLPFLRIFQVRND
jgi:peptidoglycan/LPS O-acetylase OafA/YrhL